MSVQQGGNPFKGLYSYKEEDKHIFYGRDRETKELYKLVKLNMLTVVFGESGIGKTSLIHAGLFPFLRKEGFLPVSIRLDYMPSSAPLFSQVVQRIQKELTEYDIRELEKGQNVSTDSFRPGETLWEYFHRVDHVDKIGNRVTPVLVLDQFEEIFNIGRNHPHREVLVEELYYLVENQIPDALQKKFLEEGEMYPYIHEQASVRVMLGLRENYLPHVNSLKQRIPSIDRVLYRVIHLNGRQARDVMSIPGAFEEEGIKEDILRQFYPEDMDTRETVPDEKLEVEPSLLSLLCYQMFEKKATSLSRQEKNDILSEFYDDVLRKLPNSKDLAEFIEKRLLTEAGFRTPFYLEHSHPLRDAVEKAVDSNILRKVYYGEKENVEIIHDVLVPVIKERRNKRLEEKRKREARQRQNQIISRVIAVAGIISILLAVFAFDQKNRADWQYKVAKSNRLAAESFLRLPADNAKAIRIAEAAYIMKTPHPSSSVQQALSASAYSTFERPFYTINMQHKNKVTSATFAPDGNSVLTTSMDGTVELWDIMGKPLAHLDKYTNNEKSAVFSPGGTKILTVCRDNTVRLWDLNGRPLDGFEPGEKVGSAIFSPGGQTILTRSENTVTLWDLKGKFLADLRGHTGYISSTVFSPDGTKILTASWDKTVKLWDLRNLSGKILADLNKHTDYVWSAVFSPDGTKILTASSDHTAKLWDSKGSILKDFLHTDKVWSAIFSPDGGKILTRWGKKATLWDLNGNSLADLNKYAEDVNSAAFSPDSKTILITSANTAKLLDLKGNLLADLNKHTDYVAGVVFSPDGNKVLTASSDRTAKIWDFKEQLLVDLNKYTDALTNAVVSPKGTQILTWSGNIARVWDLKENHFSEFNKHNAFISSAAFSPEGSKILTGSWDNTAILWDLPGNLPVYFKHNLQVIYVAFSPEGSKILTVSYDCSVTLWDLQGKLLADLNQNRNDVSGATLSPGGNKMLTWGGNSAKLWDLNDNLLADLKKHTDDITGAVFSPEGTQIITTSRDKTAKLWDLKGHVLADLRMHTDSVNGAVFSPKGTQILTFSDDNTAKLWDLQGNLLADLNRHKGPVLSAAFSPDGSRVITVSKDGTVKRWYTPEAIIQWLKNAPIPNLSPEDKENLGIADFKNDF